MVFADEVKDGGLEGEVSKPAVVRSKYTNYPTSDGKTRDAELGFKSDLRRMGELIEKANHVESMLRLNHEAIEDCAALLNKSQPPMSGKLEVRWWSAGGKSFPAQPTVIVWGKEKGRPKRVAPIGLVVKASKRGGFQNNYADTCLLLGTLQGLLEDRKTLLKYVEDFNRITTRFSLGGHERVLKMGRDKLFQQIEKRIDEKAYEVERLRLDSLHL